MEYPALGRAADQVAHECQRRFFLLRGGEFCSLVLAALLAAIPADLAVYAPAGAFLAFVAALGLRISGAGDHQEGRWYEARAAAESIKSSSWQYAVGGEAYRVWEADAQTRFIEALMGFIEVLPNLNVPVGGTTDLAVTEAMRDLRVRPLADRVDAYISGRVHDQLKWYCDKAGHNRSRARFWIRTLIGVEVVAVVLGLARALGVVDVDWLGLLAALGAAVAAWQQTKNYSLLGESYSVTSHEVGMIADLLAGEQDEESWSQAVHDAEAAFSREHTLWKARRQGPRNV